jgi:hypothetical protein
LIDPLYLSIWVQSFVGSLIRHLTGLRKLPWIDETEAVLGQAPREFLEKRVSRKKKILSLFPAAALNAEAWHIPLFFPFTSRGCWKNRNVVSDNGTCEGSTTPTSLLNRQFTMNEKKKHGRRDCFDHLRTVFDVLSEAQCLLNLRGVRESAIF